MFYLSKSYNQFYTYIIFIISIIYIISIILNFSTSYAKNLFIKNINQLSIKNKILNKHINVIDKQIYKNKIYLLHNKKNIKYSFNQKILLNKKYKKYKKILTTLLLANFKLKKNSLYIFLIKPNNILNNLKSIILINNLILKIKNITNNTINKLIALKKNHLKLTQKQELIIKNIKNLQKQKNIFLNQFKTNKKKINIKEEKIFLIPFINLKNKLLYPVKGKILKKFGDLTINGYKTKGITILTKPLSKIISPASGVILFANTFSTYGYLIIIDVGSKYNILLTGLGKITITSNQFIKIGDQIGFMPKKIKNLYQNKINSPILYIEFRYFDKPIDSKYWWKK